MTKKSRQKFKYLENETSFWGEIKCIFHLFKRDFNCQKLSQIWECTFKPQFLLFQSSKYYQTLWKHSFYNDYYDILNKLATVFYPFCFKKQTLEVLLYLSFKVEVPTNGLQDISFLLLKSIQTWKNCCKSIESSIDF